ncbi:hypothetical protein V8C26DRAFT_399694 [Trichoderma gracile]
MVGVSRRRGRADFTYYLLLFWFRRWLCISLLHPSGMHKRTECTRDTRRGDTCNRIPLVPLQDPEEALPFSGCAPHEHHRVAAGSQATTSSSSQCVCA